MTTVCGWCNPGSTDPLESTGICPACLAIFEQWACPACSGMGVPAGGDEIDTYYPCPECGGSGLRKKVAA